MNINDLPERYQKQARQQLKNNTASRSSKQKQDRSDALEQAAEIPKLHTPVYVIVTVYRKGTGWDADNIETKAIIDALVKIGAINNDTIKEVPKVIKQGYEAKTADDERTEIEVYSI